MPVNLNWPLTATQVAFNAGFATAGALSWTDLTPRMWSLGAGYGRNYELDQNQTGTGSIVLADKDEVLNPANPNPGYPFAGNILPYRPAMVQAQWPPLPVGAAVNLLNALTQSQPYDPSFESYVAAATVPWISAVGGTSPVVGTTTPNSGTKDLTWTVASSTTVQGVSYQVPCIPGQQYTSSAYVRQTSASTQRISVTDQTQVIDAFGRTTANGWGAAEVGTAWTASGTAGDYSTAARVAYHSNGTVNAARTTVAGSALADTDQRVTVTIPVVATGAEIDAGLIARFADASNYYFAELRFNTDTSLGLRIQRIVAGTITSIGTAVLFTAYTAGSVIYLRFQTVGPTVQAKAWLYGTAEPAAWTVTATDTNITAAGQIGCRSILATSNTNTLPVAMAFSDYNAIGSVVGTSTSATGAYNRLTATWTATQPMHTIQVATTGTAVAGTVLVDDVQHEPGAAANTATTTGPVIYGVHRGYVERWPSTWKYQGMYGYAQITTVDAFAALAAKKLHTAYAAAILAKVPTYYYRLGEPQGATTFADTSGNNGPPLLTWISPAGAGTAPAPGTAHNMAGDPSGVGIKFVEGGATVGGNDPGTMLGAGPAFRGPVAAFPVTANGSSFGVTLSAWVQLTYPLAAPRFILKTATFLPLNGNQISPGSLIANFDGSLDMTVFGPGGGFANIGGAAAANAVNDGKAHLVVGTVSQAVGGNTVLTLYLDGVLYATTTSSTATVGLITAPVTNVMVAGRNDGTNTNQIIGGTVAHVALFARALSSTEITDLWNASKGYVGETSGQRVTRYLTGNYAGAQAIDSGQSIMGADVLTEDTILLAGCQAVGTTENGNFWADGTGTVTFYSRTRRYFSTTSKYTFGEQELPYQGDIGFDFDPQLIYNEVAANNAGGISALAVDPTSRIAFGPRSFSRDLNVQSDNEAVDAATWILATHKDPHQRIERLTLEPSSNPALWPVALGIKIGDRVTAKRRTAAFTMTADYFVENIAHNQGPTQWTVTLEMSPASFWPTPWVLDDVTYSVLGTTTILGY